ncbi:hypothetical protein HDU67_000930 [Dinochytrium kinnereticum]|nr:hypothetical protein HDU67_000930 [Dinochytrium kinnereticum]
MQDRAAFNSRFVSTSVVQPGTNAETAIAPSQSFGIEIDAPTKVQEYDPRPLYERLQEEREKKDAEFAEKIKLDEAQFLQARDDELARRRREQEKDIKAALVDYRSLVQEARSLPTPTAIPSLRPPSLSFPPPSAATAPTSASLKKPALEGIVVRKRKGNDAASENSPLAETSASSAGPVPTTSASASKPPTALTARQQDSTKGPASKKVKAETAAPPKSTQTPAAAAAAAAGLSSLAGYDSDSDST